MKPSLWPISCFLSCQKILFLAEVIAISEIAHFLWLLATPYIYKVWCKQRYIWVLASTLDPSVSKINEALSVTYKLLFILSKNIVPSRSYRYISDMIAHFCDKLASPLTSKVWCKATIHIWVLASTLAHSASEIIKPSLWPISCFLSCQKILFLAEVIAISEIAHFLWLLATPYIYISTLHQVWCYKLLFILSPSRSIFQRYIHIYKVWCKATVYTYIDR